MKVYLSFILCIFCNYSYAQKIILGDSLKIEFLPDAKNIRTVSKEGDLTYKIIFTNIAQSSVYSYSHLVFDKSPNIFANYDCPLYKKSEKGFKRANRYAISSVYGFYFDS